MRSIVLGNGSFTVCLDEWGQVRDVFFPYVGVENHAGGHLVHKLGVYEGDRMHWVDSGEWEARIHYAEDSMASAIRLLHAGLALELSFSDVVYNEHNAFVRHLILRSLRPGKREVKIFFNQQFFIAESARGDTAYYSMDGNALIHYEGRRVFLISGIAGERAFDDYSTGLCGIEGKEGTWRDAEDGMLAKNPIEYGTVDSTLAFALSLSGKKPKEIWYWITAGKTYQEVMRLHRDMLTRTPAHLLESTTDFWRAWLTKRAFPCEPLLSPEALSLYRDSLLVMRAHTDAHGGIIASADSSILQGGRDTYSYVWPRDASFSALAFLAAGYPDLAKRHFVFMDKAMTEDGYLLHKYKSDGSLGSSWHPWVRAGAFQPPIQEDETAVVLWALWLYYESTRDLEFVETLYNSLIKRAANFFVRYRDEESGLPLPSHDLWEERFGVHTYTVASVYGALTAAARFAALLGKEQAAGEWSAAAERMKEALLTHMCMQDGRIRRTLLKEGKSVTYDETPDMSAWYGLYRFGVLAPNDARLLAGRALIEQAVINPHVRGGLGRYRGDAYYRVRADVPGNPWILTSLWATEHAIAMARSQEELVTAGQALAWAGDCRTRGGMLPEQIDPGSGAPLSATPLVWSHAQYVLVVATLCAKAASLQSGQASACR